MNILNQTKTLIKLVWTPKDLAEATWPEGQVYSPNQCNSKETKVHTYVCSRLGDGRKGQSWKSDPKCPFLVKRMSDGTALKKKDDGFQTYLPTEMVCNALKNAPLR